MRWEETGFKNRQKNGFKLEIPFLLVLKGARCIDKPPWLGLEALDPWGGHPTAVQNPAIPSCTCMDQICPILALNILRVWAVRFQGLGFETLLKERCSLRQGRQELAG